MNWKNLFPLPLAALIVATPLELSKLKHPIPLLTLPSCNYPRALRAYLEAYAYTHENRPRARLLLRIANTEANSCGEKAGVLRERITALRGILFPLAESFPHQLP